MTKEEIETKQRESFDEACRLANTQKAIQREAARNTKAITAAGAALGRALVAERLGEDDGADITALRWQLHELRAKGEEFAFVVAALQERLAEVQRAGVKACAAMWALENAYRSVENRQEDCNA